MTTSTQNITAHTATKPVLTSEGAQAVLQAAMAKAVELGAPMCIAVVDDGGTLKAFMRMDRANLAIAQAGAAARR